MSIATTEYNALLDRVRALEERVNNIVTALSKMITIDQVAQLGLIRQTEVAQHAVRLEGIETRLEELESYHRT